MIVTLFPFQLSAGRDANDLVEVFRRHRILETARQVEGCRGVYLAGGMEDDAGRAYAVGIWDDTDAYQRWLDHPERPIASEDINALLQERSELDVPGQVLPVLHSAE